jgi:hypothetical protein
MKMKMQLVLWTLIIHGSQREHIEATAAPKTKTGPENQSCGNTETLPCCRD